MKLISLSWKNIWRNKLRSLIVIMAVAIGLFCGMFASSVLFGLSKQKIDSAIEYEITHIQIHNPAYLENKEIQYTIPDAKAITEYLENIPEVKAVSQRIKITGMICSANTAKGIQIYGIEPEKEKKVSAIYKSICDTCGNYFEGVNRYPIVISQRMAEKLKIRLRSKVVIRFQSADGNLTEGAFKVTGLFKTINEGYDESNVFVKASDLQQMTRDGIKIHEIAIQLKDDSKVDLVAQQLKNKYPGLNIMTWGELEPVLGFLNNYLDIYFYAILGIILLALSFGIVNTMLMIVLERIRELGMLLAIGMNKLRIFKMIMYETILLSLTGGIIGMIISYLAIAYFGNNGIRLSGASKGMEAIGFNPMVYPYVKFGFYIALTIMVIATGIFSSMYPAKKALKLNPAEAVRSE